MIKFESESHLQNFLFENIDLLGIEKKASLFKEFKIGAYGIIDLISFQFKILDIEKRTIALEINLIELKNNKSSYYELGQLCRYMTGLKNITKNISDSHFKIIINGILICPNIDLSSDFTMLYNFMHNKITIKTFKINPLKGLVFSEESKDYTVTDSGWIDINDILPSYGTMKTECIKSLGRAIKESGINNG